RYMILCMTLSHV
ncbi:hypothetical protein CFC21_010063, partial [Triticum aestivum]